MVIPCLFQAVKSIRTGVGRVSLEKQSRNACTKMLEHNRNTRKEKVLDHNGNTHKVEMHTQMEVLMHIRRKQSCMNPLREDLHGGCI